jgi:hypothetical protein
VPNTGGTLSLPTPATHQPSCFLAPEPVGRQIASALLESCKVCPTIASREGAPSAGE